MVCLSFFFDFMKGKDWLKELGITHEFIREISNNYAFFGKEENALLAERFKTNKDIEELDASQYKDENIIDPSLLWAMLDILPKETRSDFIQDILIQKVFKDLLPKLKDKYLLLTYNIKFVSWLRILKYVPRINLIKTSLYLGLGVAFLSILGLGTGFWLILSIPLLFSGLKVIYKLIYLVTPREKWDRFVRTTQKGSCGLFDRAIEIIDNQLTQGYQGTSMDKENWKLLSYPEKTKALFGKRFFERWGKPLGFKEPLIFAIGAGLGFYFVSIFHDFQ